MAKQDLESTAWYVEMIRQMDGIHPAATVEMRIYRVLRDMGYRIVHVEQDGALSAPVAFYVHDVEEATFRVSEETSTTVFITATAEARNEALHCMDFALDHSQSHHAEQVLKEMKREVEASAMRATTGDYT